MSGTIGDNVYRASGVVAAASAGTSWQDVETGATFTAVAGNGYPVNTTAQACTVTLPAGSVGDTIEFVDYAGTWDTNNVTLTTTEKIKGSTEDGFLDGEREAATITYVDATQGWITTSAANETSPVVALPTFVAATGPDGASGTTDGDYKVHIFTATKTGSNGFSVSNGGNAAGSNTVEYLVIAGGASGGSTRGGGGGAGGMLTATGLSVTAQDYDVTIGDGGAAATGVAIGTDGNDSIFSSITSTAGGGGGCGAIGDGRDGGSGGGSAGDGGNSGGSGTAGQGNDGGSASVGAPVYPCGGGGGKGAVGASVSSGTTAGAGGAGEANDIVESGTDVTYAGGGGGGVHTTGTGGAGGAGGGGAGGTQSYGTAGTANTGGGGGGGGDNTGSNNVSGAGGSGYVVIRYKFQ